MTGNIDEYKRKRINKNYYFTSIQHPESDGAMERRATERRETECRRLNMESLQSRRQNVE